MKKPTPTRTLLAGACAAAMLLPTAVRADNIVWDGTTDQNWTNGPQDASLVTFPNNGSLGANWTINAGAPGQIVAPVANKPNVNLIDYLYAGHDWTINNATISEDVQVLLEGGSLSITNSTVSLLPTSATTAAKLSGLNLGQNGVATTAVFTSSEVTVGRSNEGSGNSMRVLGGSSLTLVGSTVNTKTELNAGVTGRVALEGAGSSLTMDAASTINTGAFLMTGDNNVATINGGTMNTGFAWTLTGLNAAFNATGATVSAGSISITNTGSSFTINGGSLSISGTGDAFQMTNAGQSLSLINADVDITGDFRINSETSSATIDGGTFDAGSIRLNPGDATQDDIMLSFVSGAMTLTDPNPLRGSRFEGSFDWVGDAGAATLTHTDLSANDTNLAGKMAAGYFGIDGTRVFPSIAAVTDWTQQANIDALNAELQGLAVNGKYFKLTQDLGAGTQVLALLSAVIPGDTDGDGDVDDSDLGAAFSNYTGPGGTGKTVADGDTDGDGDVDDGDLGTAFSNYTGPLGPAVPEPTSLALLGLGGMALARRRRG